MEGWLILLLLSLPIFAGRARDPSPGIFQSKEEARNLECIRMSQVEAHERFPGQVPAPPARTLSSPKVTDALACQRRFMRLGERPDRDEVVLTTLRQSSADIAQTAASLAPRDVVWHVDAFYPDAAVAAKISVAARTDLAERGHRVSDRVPLLAAGDLLVIGRMDPKEAYPTACARYHAEGALAPGDALLGITIVDPRETLLHAGLCVDGGWRWFR